ncbi:MAG: hypothetical protein QM728_10435 [Gordonia sp. (in: high G+C Gram-positive bacteria)]|uniref:DUF6670 family protein n=1 Tax=Gordonia sp. (in: high G+C Gram-positive bacteria) TaxID=84139 RepID=UPI0039E35501
MITGGALPLLDSRLTGSVAPYTGKPAMVPHNGQRRWSMVHYGVFLPLLPEPYRYLNTMTLIGAPGVEMFDTDENAAADARNTTTVFSSTAYNGENFFKAYDTAVDCEFADDGSHLRWGDDLTIDVAGDTAHVVGSYPGFSVDFTSTITDEVSYFVRTPVYDHLSLLAPFRGTLTDERGTTEISGLGTFEYAQAMTPQSVVRQPMPTALKLPGDFFTYQIIQLDEQRQLLLTCVGARDSIACLLVHLRTLGEPARVFDDVSFEVLDYGDPLVDSQGRAMRVPTRFRWLVRDGGTEILNLEGTPDAPWRSGHGRGYVSAYSYTGEVFSDTVDGSGYIEWIDTRDEPRPNWCR